MPCLLADDLTTQLTQEARALAAMVSIYQDPVSISEKTSYHKISWSLEATRFVFRIVRSLWNLTGTSAALLPMCLSNFKAIQQFKVPILWLRDFTRSYDKTSFRILRRGPGVIPEYNNFSTRKVNSLWPSDAIWWLIWVNIGSGNDLPYSTQLATKP